MAKTMKDWALLYAEMGFAVFPVKPPRMGGGKPGKEPMTAHGFMDATKDAVQIWKWWDTNPDANIGIATGKASGGLVVIDLDIDEEKGINGYETFKKWQQKNGTLPDTWQSITGRRGYHLFYKDDATNRNRTGLYEGIDIRGDGGYIIAPPSRHENGNTYQWETGPGDNVDIAQVNGMVMDFLLGEVKEINSQTTFHQPEVIPDGERTMTMIRLVGTLKAKGLDDESIMAAVRAENEKKCVPPLTDKELDKTVFTALKRGWETTAPYAAVHDKGKFRQQKKPREKISLVCMADIDEEETTWLYQPYVPRGKVTLCAAYPGTGKTYLLCYMAACVSTGKSFFNIVPFEGKPGTAIYLTSEDGIGDTIKKRLRICGADMSRVFSVSDGENHLLFDSPEIEEYMRDYRPDLMIFDPFQSYIGADVDMNAPNKTREQMGHIVELAKKYDVAVVIICHFNKNGKGDAITRVLGSTDIMGACRSYIALGNVPGEDDMKFMSHEKSSLERRGKTMLFEIDPDEGGIVYLGENALSMDDYTNIGNKKRANNAPAVEAAKMFIVNNMPEGRRSAKELFNLAKANKISESSMRRARDELEMIQRKTKTFPSITEWILPGHERDEIESVQGKLDLQSDQSL